MALDRCLPHDLTAGIRTRLARCRAETEGESAAVAGVDHNDLLICPALVLDLPVDESGTDSRLADLIGVGVGRDEHELAISVLDTVTTDVDQDEVFLG